VEVEVSCKWKQVASLSSELVSPVEVRGAKRRGGPSNVSRAGRGVANGFAPGAGGFLCWTVEEVSIADTGGLLKGEKGGGRGR